jgi:hypothetical protein
MISKKHSFQDRRRIKCIFLLVIVVFGCCQASWPNRPNLELSLVIPQKSQWEYIATLERVEPITVVVLTAGNRLGALRSILRFYLNSANKELVREVKLVSNSRHQFKLEPEIIQDKRFKVHWEKKNTLNNRYRHWDTIESSATLLLDDDCLVRNVEKAIAVQSRYSERIVCFYARAHTYNERNKTWKYVNPKHTHGRYSLCTGQATLLATHWLKDFNTDPQAAGFRQFINKNIPTCEDIALHMYVANKTNRGPILVHAEQKTLRGTESGMSSMGDWGSKRRECLNKFISTFFNGRNPLVYSEFNTASF